MFSNEQVAAYVIELTKEMQQYINVLDQEIRKSEPDLKSVALNVGKLSKVYCLITNLVGTFTGEDMRIGGFRESVKIMKKQKEDDGD